ncbi:hypothetical protein NC652_032943 [Populus alba x Populus x berolinensis]|nr:hypothetical protein NC652_032943 [Populus alba x Populus x berolinensis]
MVDWEDNELVTLRLAAASTVSTAGIIVAMIAVRAVSTRREAGELLGYRIIHKLELQKNKNLIASRARSDVRVSGLNQNVRLYGQFSAPVKQETKRTNEEEEKQNYYVNIGYAIRTLREEFPGLFYRELSFDIYRRYNARGHIDTQTHGKAGMRSSG